MSELTRIPSPGPPPRFPLSVRRAAEPDFDDSFDLRHLVRVLARHTRPILLVALLVLVPVAAWSLLAPPLYRSSTLVNIDPDPVQVLGYREIDRPSLTSNYELFMKSQDELLRSPILLARLAQRLESEPDNARLVPEIPRLYKRLSVARVENTQMFRLSYLAPAPETAARIANLFADEFIRRQFEAGEQTREKARGLLQRELDALEARIQVSEQEMVEYAQQNRLSPSKAADRDGAAQQRQDLLEKQTAEAEAVVFAAKSRLNALRSATIDDYPQALVTSVISGLVTRLVQLEHDLTALRATFGENWPAVVQKRSEVALVREQLTREKRSALAQAREQASMEYLGAENTRAMLATSLAAQEQRVNTADSASIQFNILRREVETNQKLYEGLLERLKQTSLTSGMEFGGFRVIDPAMPDTEQYSPRLLWNLVLASCLGLALGICIAIGRDYWDTTVSTIEEVERLTLLPVLASVPFAAEWGARRGTWWPALTRRHAGNRRPAAALALSDGADTGTGDSAVPGLGQQPAIADAVRNLCASILLSRPGQPPRVLLITSAQPGEGKSTIARELAQAIGERGPKTLLVECDLRRPTASTRFGVSSQGGLSLWLAGIDNTPPTPHQVSPALSVIVAGPPTPNPVRLLDSDRMRTFVADMLKNYPFIILDAPPVMGLADARVLAPLADGVVLVVRAGMAQKPSIRRACWHLESVGATVLGTVLNEASSDEDGYYDYGEYARQDAR